jgi:hypothetical protein
MRKERSSEYPNSCIRSEYGTIIYDLMEHSNAFRRPRLTKTVSSPNMPMLKRTFESILTDPSVSKTMANAYIWKKTDTQFNHVANVRYAHGDELSDLPGVIGIGIGKDHIILYVSDQSVEIPNRIEDVAIVKIFRK